MGPKQQIWSQDAELLLIHLVRARPTLWDITLDEYRRTDLKEIHWEEIAQAMGPRFTSATVKKRFINIKDTFMENLRKVKGSMQRASGKGADEIYKPKWPLYNNLLFLQKACTIVPSTSNISTPKQALAVSQCPTEANTSISQFSASKLTSSDAPVSLYWDKTLKAYILPEEKENFEGDTMISLEDSLLSPDGDIIDSQGDSIDTQCSPLSPVESLSSSTFSFPERPASAPNTSMSTKATFKESLYKKRGVKKFKTSTTQEALELMKQVISQPVVVSSGDATEHFGSYIAARLKEMDPIQRRHCEDIIMKALNSS